MFTVALRLSTGRMIPMDSRMIFMPERDASDMDRMIALLEKPTDIAAAVACSSAADFARLAARFNCRSHAFI